jgi:hypothetical protein
MILSCPGASFMAMIVTDRIIGVYGQVLAPSRGEKIFQPVKETRYKFILVNEEVQLCDEG